MVLIDEHNKTASFQLNNPKKTTLKIYFIFKKALRPFLIMKKTYNFFTEKTSFF